MNKYIKYFVIFILLFSVRLYFDNRNLENAKINTPKETQTHIFQIRDDPEYKYFATSTIAIDRNLHQRVLISSNAVTSSKLMVFNVGDSLQATGYFEPLNNYESYLYQQHVVAKFNIEKILEYSILSIRLKFVLNNQALINIVCHYCVF